MSIEQLRCNYDIPELFQEECILGPTKPAVKSGLYVSDTVSATIGPVMGL